MLSSPHLPTSNLRGLVWWVILMGLRGLVKSFHQVLNPLTQPKVLAKLVQKLTQKWNSNVKSVFSNPRWRRASIKIWSFWPDPRHRRWGQSSHWRWSPQQMIFQHLALHVIIEELVTPDTTKVMALPKTVSNYPFICFWLDNFLFRHLPVRVCLHHIQRCNCRPTPPHPPPPHLDLQETEGPIPKATFSNGVVKFQEEKVPFMIHLRHSDALAIFRRSFSYDVLWKIL